MKSPRLLLFAALLPVAASAATYQWDPNDSASGLGGSGTWDTTTANWDDTAAGTNDGTDATAAVTFSTVTSDAATFGGTAGTVTMGTSVTLSTTTFTTSGYTLDTNGNTLTTTTLALGSGLNFTKDGTGLLTTAANGTISGSGLFTIKNGTYRNDGLSGGTTFTGKYVVESNGLLQVGTGANRGNVFGSTQTAQDAVTLKGGKILYNRSANLAINYGVTVDATLGGTLEVNMTGSTVALTQAASCILGNAGGGALAVTLTRGTLTLSQANNITGAISVASNGILNVTGTGRISSGTAGAVTVNGGTFDYSSSTAQALSGITLSSGTISGTGALSTAGSIAVSSGTLSAAVGGSGSLTKNTTGAATVSGTNTYTGTTTVNAGTLTVSGTVIADNSAGGVTVASGATLVLNGTLKLEGASSTIANAGTVSGTGVLDLQNFFNSYNGGASGSYALITGTGSKSGAAFSVLGSSYDTGVWSSVTFDNTTGNLVFTAVPEPSTYALSLAGAFALAAFARRRKNRLA